MHYFKWDKYLFQVFYLEKIIAYNKYYFLLQDKNIELSDEIIFLVLQDEKTQEIQKLTIEDLYKKTQKE